jgi:MAF protein
MLILASNSPRRKQLLESIGWDFISISPEVDEQVIEGENPEEYTRRVAKTKAQAAIIHPEVSWKKGDLILAADTAVVDPARGSNPEDKQRAVILGKPATLDEAQEMLFRLRGHSHQVCTSVTVLDPVEGSIREATEFSSVTMRNYTLDEMKKYISSRDPLDKAGGYAIQHSKFRSVEKVSGCYPNVAGLPVCQVIRLAAESGYYPNNFEMELCNKSESPCWIYRGAFQGVKND